MLVLMLALPVSRGEDPPKDKKDPTVKEQYDALVKDFGVKQGEVRAEANKAKGDEQQKLYQKYSALGKDFADKFYNLAEADPKGPVATDALFWIVQNAAGSSVSPKAADKVTALIGEMPIKDLSRRLNGMRGANPTILDAVLKRAEKDEKDPLTGDLVAWAATSAYYLPAGQKAMDRLLDKYPEHPAVERVVGLIGRMGDPKAEDKLKQLLQKSAKPKVKAAAAVGLGRMLAGKTDELGDKPAEADKMAAEAETYLIQAIELFGKDSEAQRKDAEGELKALRTLRVGKEAPEIKGGDLDGKDFKLTDYRGKVVLLDFWGQW